MFQKKAEGPERTREVHGDVCKSVHSWKIQAMARGNVHKLEKEVDSPVEGREVKLQRGLQRCCSSASSQVSSVDSLPLIGQALVALYMCTDGTGNP